MNSKPKSISQLVEFSVCLQTRQCAQGHRTYEVGITKCEVKFVLNLEAIDLLVSDELRKDVLGMSLALIVSEIWSK